MRKMKKNLVFVILIFFIFNKGISQKNETNYDDIRYNAFTRLLEDYDAGFTISFIFMKKKKTVKYVKTISSNNKTKANIDSFMCIKNFILLNKLKKGNYVIPIIQVAINTQDENDFNWKNYHPYNFFAIEKELLFSEDLRMLKPIIIYSSKPIIN